ncbi:CPBP family intramembrane glutamic endopeptidase [Nocardia sp. NBC_01327]|uniref:CPBP family intramembrane glutamic endopeptidase n=1 Tax=Nocardia sp. NBC_01327 TaxID=2903593 RepID=UPI002E0FFFD2|nr:CPBP family intramembrane metalloprotease [Nocardia sp. NBC_01327]
MNTHHTRALPSPDSTSAEDRFGRLIERNDGDDFPFYNGVPVALSVRQWVVAIIAVVAGFVALIAIPQPNNFVALIPRALFVGIPLLTLALITRDHWRALFREVRGRDVRTMFGFALLNIVVSFVLALIVSALFGVASNEVMEDAGQSTALDTAAFYVGTGIQLVGEEVFTMLPFLALMSFVFGRVKPSRRTAIVLAWLVSAVWFGAAHLPTYDWNFAQAFIIIGGARLVLTLAYIRTKNLWVSSGAHIINDWALFTQAVLVNSALIA